VAFAEIIERLRLRGLMPLVEEVCQRRGVTLEEMCGKDKKKSKAHARHEVWWRMYYHPDRAYSFPEIAEFFERGEHTTIMAGVRAHERRSSEKAKGKKRKK
jgi:chromosomal replication initiation ATPase DnaA